MTATETLVDARGLLCPWPVLRLVRAARESGERGSVRLLADDPAAAGELAQLCSERGWTLATDPGDPHLFRVIFP